MQDVLEVLTTEEMWIGVQLEVTRNSMFSLNNFDQNEAKWTVGSQKAEHTWMKEYCIDYENNTTNSCRARKAASKSKWWWRKQT
jgi:hypothetical protein